MRFFACSVLFSQCAWGPPPPRANHSSALRRDLAGAFGVGGRRRWRYSTKPQSDHRPRGSGRESRTANREVTNLPASLRSSASAAAAAESSKPAPAPAAAAESAPTKTAESTAESTAEAAAEWSDAAVPSAPLASAPSSPWSRAAAQDHDDQEDDRGNEEPPR